MTKDEKTTLAKLADAFGLPLDGENDLDEVVSKALELKGELEAAKAEGEVADFGPLRDALIAHLDDDALPALKGASPLALMSIAVREIEHAGEVSDALEAATEEAFDFEPIREALEVLGAESTPEGEEPPELPESDADLVAAVAVLISELPVAAERVRYLEGALEEAATDIEELGEALAADEKPPGYVQWRENGRISRGHVRIGMVASHELGDYEIDDLRLAAHVVIDARKYGAHSRKFGGKLGRAKSPAAAKSPAEAAEKTRRRAKSKRGGTMPRFGALRGDSRHASGSSTPTVTTTVDRDLKVVPRKSKAKAKAPKATPGKFKLRGNPKGRPGTAKR